LIVFFLFGISLRRRSKSSARYVTISCAVGNGLLLLLLLPLEDDAAKVDRALDRAAPAVMLLLLLLDEDELELPLTPSPSCSSSSISL
jgi:hypothetical protein